MAIAARGEVTKALRAENERSAAAKKAYEVIRRAKRQKKASIHFQRLYRGHIGRKAGRRWAMKKAELEAMNALMHASALTMERAFRGYVGRMHAAEARAEMAEFIAMIRMEEAAADEDYWRTSGQPEARLEPLRQVLDREGVSSEVALQREPQRPQRRERAGVRSHEGVCWLAREAQGSRCFVAGGL